MENQEDYKKTLTQIRDLMEGSAKVHTIGGTTGILAGLTALAGFLAFYVYFGIPLFEPVYLISDPYLSFLLADGQIVLIVAIVACSFVVLHTAKAKNLKVVTPVFKRFFTYWFIPLFTGGILFVPYILGYPAELFPKTIALSIIFFGLAQVGASRYSFNEFFWQGLLLLVLGIIAFYCDAFVLLFWVLAFGVSNIVAGALVYLQYERRS